VLNKEAEEFTSSRFGTLGKSTSIGDPTFAALFTALTIDLSMYPVFLNHPSYKGGIPLLLSNNMLVEVLDLA
jgi:hypothetical protein